MPFRNTKRAWGSLSKALHWLIVLLIINQWLIAERAEDLTGFQKFTALNWHKWFGMTIFMLAIVRLVWRIANPVPDLTAETRPWERVLARVSHFLLYALIFAMPLTGWIMDSGYKDAATHPMFLYGLFEWPRIGFIMHLDPPVRDRVHDLFGEAHELISWLVYALFALHVAGALKHQMEGHKELQRMLP